MNNAIKNKKPVQLYWFFIYSKLKLVANNILNSDNQTYN